MTKLLVWGIVIVALAAILDRLLLWMERRGWLFYRRTRGRGGGSLYHMLELHSVFDPGIEQVQEIKVKEERHQDESGDPPGSDGSDDHASLHRFDDRPGPDELDDLRSGRGEAGSSERR